MTIWGGGGIGATPAYNPAPITTFWNGPVTLRDGTLVTQTDLTQIEDRRP